MRNITGEIAMQDFKGFEDFLYEKFARSTVQETVRKMKFLAKQTDLARDSIMDYFRDLRRLGSPGQKINEYVKVCNRWLAFKNEDKILYLKSPRRSFKVRYFDAEQIGHLLSKSKGPTLEEKRNHAMILLALNTGLRRGEISNLMLSDVHEAYVSVIQGKGEKDRDVYIDQDTRKTILEYASVRNHPESQYLFTTKLGKITDKYMGNIAGDIRKKTGIDFSWHKCRHTYARNLVKNDIDLETIRQMLGHENLGTTQIYAELSQEEAIQRISDKQPKFFREGKGFKPHKPRTTSDGPKGI